MAMRLVLMLEAHQLHYFQFEGDNSPLLPAPNLGKIDHLNNEQLPPVALKYCRTDGAAQLLPTQLQHTIEEQKEGRQVPVNTDSWFDDADNPGGAEGELPDNFA